MRRIEEGLNQAICQKWEETERGWGERPDGFSLHLSFEAVEKYIKGYWDQMPDEVPADYSRPSGTPYPVGVSDKVFAEIEAREFGLRFYGDYALPGSGGIDGWLPINQQDLPNN